MEVSIPNHYRCPISLDLMKDPVTLSTGITYDRDSIERWIVEGGNSTCPITSQVLTSLNPIPNHTIRKMIQNWCVQNQSRGIQRIPTPRAPISSLEVSEILDQIASAADGCRDLVAKIKASAKESDRNKRCIATNGAAAALSLAFETFSKDQAGFHKNAAVLEEILSALALFPPLDKSSLGSASSLHCMVWFLEGGDLSGRRNAILVLKEILSSSDKQKLLEAFAEIEGALPAVFKLVKEPICPTATKASLMVIYHMVRSPSSSQIVERFVEMGLVSLLLEMLVDSEKSICEKALGVLDGICSAQKGREKAYAHALTMPVVVKKILRVSDLATELSVSILWKLCKNETGEEGSTAAMVEALRVGAFQKLLLLLQVGCVERIKEKVTDLLKILNLHRNSLECIDSMDFKELKRPF